MWILYFVCFLFLSMPAVAMDGQPAQQLPGADQKSSGVRPDVGDLVAQAKKMLDQHKVAEAKQAIDAALRREPKNVFALKELARFYLIDGMIGSTIASEGTGATFEIKVYRPGALQDAQEALTKAININPKYADAWALLAHVFVENTETKEAGLKIARTALMEADKYEPDNPWVHYYWAELLVHEGKWDEAVSHCLRIMEVAQDDRRVFLRAVYFLIDYYTNKRDYEKADALYRHVLVLAPSDYIFMINYSGFLRVGIGDFNKAIEYADKSLRIAPTHEARSAMARALYAKWADISINHGDPVEAQKYFDIANMTISDLNYLMTYEGCYATERALVVALKERGISVDAPAASDGSTALMIAANNGRADAVKMLLSLGANPNAVAKTGWTALMGAADEGHEDVVDALLDAGADKDQKLNGLNAAMLATNRGQTELARKIQNYKPHVQDKKDASQL